MSRDHLKFEQILSLAREAAMEHWENYIKHNQEPLLDQCLNIGGAWMFFKNPEIEIPEAAKLRNCAFVVSQFGEVRYTADFYPDYNACMDYLQQMALHFEKEGL